MKIFLIPYCAFKCNSTKSTKEDFFLFVDFYIMQKQKKKD